MSIRAVLLLTPVVLAAIAVMVPIASAQESPPLVFCVSSENLPMSADYPPRGIEVELAGAIAARLGRDARFVWRGSHDGRLEQSVLDGRCEAVLGAIVDPGRMAQGGTVPGIALTQSYAGAGYLLIRRADAPPVQSLAELGDTRIGVEMVSIPIYTLKQNGHKVFALDDYDAVIRALADGRVEYGYLWGPLAAWLLRERNDVVVAESFTPVDRWEFAVATRASETELRRAIDEAVRSLVQEGVAARIFAGYGVPYLRPD